MTNRELTKDEMRDYLARVAEGHRIARETDLAALHLRTHEQRVADLQAGLALGQAMVRANPDILNQRPMTGLIQFHEKVAAAHALQMQKQRDAILSAHAAAATYDVPSDESRN